MNKVDCNHKWEMTNIKNGYLVVEGCSHCGNRNSFFSEGPVPPVDNYKEGEHFWTYFGSFQASKFDLKCEKCAMIVPMNDVTALMSCMMCDPDCGVFKLTTEDPKKKIWVYVALCADSSHTSRKCISKKGIVALNEYFNYNISDPMKKIVVVPCSMRKSVDICRGIVLVDTGLTELY